MVMIMALALCACGGGTSTTSSSQKEPTAIAGTLQQVVNPASVVKLDGSASGDEDGSIVSYKWTQTSGQRLN